MRINTRQECMTKMRIVTNNGIHINVCIYVSFSLACESKKKSKREKEREIEQNGGTKKVRKPKKKVGAR